MLESIDLDRIENMQMRENHPNTGNCRENWYFYLRRKGEYFESVLSISAPNKPVLYQRERKDNNSEINQALKKKKVSKACKSATSVRLTKI